VTTDVSIPRSPIAQSRVPAPLRPGSRSPISIADKLIVERMNDKNTATSLENLKAIVEK
jgi:hypothetical protein